MKTIKIFSSIIALIVFLFVQGCSLDEELIDTPTPDAIKTEEDVVSLVNGLYAGFNDASAFKFQGMMMLMLLADDIYSPNGAEFGAYAQRTFSSGHTQAFWDQLYFTIGSANNLIQVLDRLELDPQFESRAYGDAYFVRALSYYYLVRLYGPVPLRTEAVDVDSDFYLPRSPISDVYAQVLDDLKRASEQLPLATAIPTSELGRASKGAAQALLAQTNLTYGNQRSLVGEDPVAYYQSASAYADSVILSGQYNLINNYADLFDISKEAEAYKEVIFGIRFQTDHQNRAQPAAGSEFALRFMVPTTAGVTARANTTGSGDMRPMPWIADFYRTGDYASGSVLDFRNEVAFYQRGRTVDGITVQIYPNLTPVTTARVATPVLGKYIDPTGKDDRNHGNDFFIIRFAEVYLIKAEAENELNGPTATALDAFNKVRERARKADGTSRAVPADVASDTILTKTSFRMKIFEERGLELIGEGQRWFDLVRMQHPSDASRTMYEFQFFEELTKAKYPKTLPGWQAGPKKWSNSFAVYAPALNVSVPKFLLFPIPVNEFIQNPEIGPENQNIGW